VGCGGPRRESEGGRRQPNVSINGQIPLLKKTSHPHSKGKKTGEETKNPYFPSFTETTAFACRVPNSNSSSNLCPDSFFVANSPIRFRV